MAVRKSCKIPPAPDIVVRGGGKTFILDTKWKLLSADSTQNYGISQGDMYQMYAYHKKYQAKEKAENVAGCFLLYPSIGTQIDIKPFLADNGVNVNIFFVELLKIKESIECIGRKFNERRTQTGN